MTATYDTAGRRIAPSLIERQRQAAAEQQEARRKANRRRARDWLDDDGYGRDWQARRRARSRKQTPGTVTRRALTETDSAEREQLRRHRTRDGQEYRVMGATKSRTRTEITDTAPRYILLVLRTACRALDIDWETLKHGRSRAAVVARDVAACICHTRTPATWAQISYEFGREATDHRRCWGRDVGAKVRRKLAAGDPDYTAAWDRLTAAWDRLEADGIEHLVTGEIIGSGLIGRQTRGVPTRYGDGIVVYGGM